MLRLLQEAGSSLDWARCSSDSLSRRRSGPGLGPGSCLAPTPMPEQIAQLEQAHGLDKPFLAQYAAWLGDVLRGDFGKSFVTGRDVAAEIANALPVTALIGGFRP